MTKAIRWSPEMLEEYQRRNRVPPVTVTVQAPEVKPEPVKPITATPVSALMRKEEARKRFQALGRLPKGKMNQTETEYSKRLDGLKEEGQIIDWKFHPLRVRLADNTYYEVDFLVLHADMTLAIHETKGGFTTDKGQMKIKVCAETIPWFRFLKCTKLPKKQGGGWNIEEF